MPYYRAVGEIPRKRHIKAHGPDGARRHEELLGTEGFSRASALLYHRRSPSAIVGVRRVGDEAPVDDDDSPGPRHFRTAELGDGGDLVTGRRVLLHNPDVSLAVARADEASPLYRNAIGDEVVFVDAGSARLETVFGVLDVGAGDYVVVPAGATHRWVPTSDLVETFIVACAGHARIPDRYLSPHGQLLEGAPYSERDIRAPAEPLLVDGDEVDVLVRSRHGTAVYTHLTHPFDVVGWDGCFYPHAISIHDFEPIVGRIHQPPPVHQTFALPGAVLCSFVPRLYDFDPEAVKVPYHHHNVDSDEVIYYAGLHFMSRAGSGIGRASVSFHPPGFIHGPQPGSFEKADDRDRTEELAVMVDTFRPLTATATAASVEDPDYVRSWGR